MIQSGTVIDGRYEVLSRIGTGGMADVYLARDQLLGRQVAVKLLHHRFAEDQEFVERFRREASSAAGLSHPNVVAIFDRGEWDGTYYIAMEYLPGRSLKAVVREQGPLDPAAAIDIVIQILQAARFAHRRGVIHRDLKPHNVILDEEGRAKVTDFGIARAGASDMTLTGSIMGTAQYLSPEQAQGHAVSAASDIYAVGIVLYELLTGRVPFDGETAVTIALKQVSAAPLPPSAVVSHAAPLPPGAGSTYPPGAAASGAPAPAPARAAIPPELDAVVLRALAKDPAERYADADEFIAALQHVRRSLPGAGERPPVVPAEAGRHAPAAGIPVSASNGPVAPAAATALLLAPATEDAERQDPGEASARRRRRRWWIAGGVLLALVAAGVALALLLPAAKRQVTVPNVVDRTASLAATELKAAGLVPVPSQAPSLNVTDGAVISLSPAAGSVVQRGAHVSVVVSTGPASAGVPDVRGLTSAEAQHKLVQAHFKPNVQDRSSASVESGKVISTEPSQGVPLLMGSPVTVFVSSGPMQVEVPTVTGQSETEARGSLRAAGLHVGTVTKREEAGQAAGTVLSQSPSAGSSVRSGEAVSLVVAKASQEVAVPRVVGKKQERAEGELIGAGFVVKSSTRAVTNQAEAGLVLQQNPAGGTKAKRGATIKLTVGELAPQTTPSTTTTTTPSTTTTTSQTPPAAAPAVP
ncbi:MAG TPA: PASTA domain-containing protein [Solirubrobacteraceae bacterium]|jgi:serine/threonine-protein kinase|nr:PASTA domain-containing protein [Solirubrobacteraceae bacterium]